MRTKLSFESLKLELRFRVLGYVFFLIQMFVMLNITAGCHFCHLFTANKPCLLGVASLNMCIDGDKQLFCIYLCKKKNTFLEMGKSYDLNVKIYFNRIVTFCKNLCALGLMIKDMKKKAAHI